MWAKPRDSATQSTESLWKVLPQRPEGVEDGKRGRGVPERLSEFPPITSLYGTRFVDVLDIHEARLECEQNQVIAEQVRRETRIQELGSECPSAPALIIYSALIVAGIVTDAAIAKGMAGALGELGAFVSWIAGFALTGTSAFLMKAALSKTDTISSRLGERVAPWVYFAFSVLLSVLVSWFRFTHLFHIEAKRYGGGAMEQVFVNGKLPILLLLGAIPLGFSLYTAHVWDRLDRWWQIRCHHVALSVLRRRLKTIQRLLSQLEPTRIRWRKQIEAVQEACRAEYLHGVAISPEEHPANFSAVKVVLAALAIVGLSLVAGTTAYQLLDSSGINAALLAIGIVLVLSGGGLLISLPYLKKEAAPPKQLKLALPGLLSISLAATLLCSCAPAKESKKPKQVQVMVDVTKSVKASDEELTGAVLTIASRLGRCSQLTVVPINARAGSLEEVRVPCERAPYDDDLREVYKRLALELPVQLARWRTGEHLSDYKNAFTLVLERMAFSQERILIVLGDLMDDRGEIVPKSTSPPHVLPLPPESLKGTQVYIGFLPSDAIDRLGDEKRSLFERNWRRTIVSAGAADGDVSIRVFGLQGLEPWSDAVLGPVTSAFQEFSHGKAGV